MNRLLAVLIALAVAGASWTVLRLIDAGAARLDAERISWLWALGAVAAMLAFVLLYTHASASLLRAIGATRVPYGRAASLFLLAWPGRYVPAGLPYYGGRIVAAPSAGVSRAAMAASLLYENLLALSGAGSLCILLLVTALHGRVSGGAWTVVALAGVALAGVALHPATFRFALRIGSRRFGRLSSLQAHVLPGAQVPLLIGLYAVAALVAGLALWCALRAIGVQAPFAVVAVAFNIAGIAGMLAVPIPSGMGVREAAVVALLAGFVSPTDALAAAFLVRIAGVIADLLPFLGVLAWHAGDRLRHAPGHAKSPSRGVAGAP